MNCDEFRIAVGAEPNSNRADVASHTAECSKCAAYRRELLEMDGAILRALHVNVTPVTLPRRTFRHRRRWQLAAGLLLTVTTALAIWIASPGESFAEQVVDHVRNEPKSLVRTLDTVPTIELAPILSRSGVRLDPNAARISYAMSCWFRGHFVPHLVVQTSGGPVTVLVMPEEQAISEPASIDADGFKGVVVPAPRGVLVVLSQQADVAPVTQVVLGALDYER